MRTSILRAAAAALLLLPLSNLVAGCGSDETGAGGSGPGSGTSGGGGEDSACGDGFVADDEECDDGNADDADDCLSTCLVARCGDEIVRANIEECDDGNSVDGDACLNSCVRPGCGDGVVWEGNEGCDDGNQEDGDACSSACTAGSGCGNGVPEAGEECDDGNTSNSDACVGECTTAICGDGFAQLGVEECDDGNDDETDNCGSDCTIGEDPDFGCPGTQVPVGGADVVTVTGDTSVGALNENQGTCGGGDAPEVAYEILPSEDGILVATITPAGGGSDPILYARGGTCDTESAEIACDDTFGAAVVSFPVAAGGSYFLLADGYLDAAGPYELKLDLQTGVTGDTCPGNAISIDAGETITISDGNTALAGAHYKGSNGTPCSTSASTEDVVYAVTPTANGTLYVSMSCDSPNFDCQVYARSGACTTGAQIACGEESGPGGLEVISFPVTAGTKYSVFADGKNGSTGLYLIEFVLQ